MIGLQSGTGYHPDHSVTNGNHSWTERSKAWNWKMQMWIFSLEQLNVPCTKDKKNNKKGKNKLRECRNIEEED